MKIPVSIPLLFLVFCFSAAHAQWTWLNPKPAGSTAKDITFVDAQKGFIVNGSNLLRTTDAGQTWQASDRMSGSRRIAFNNQTGFVVGDYDAVFRSKDTGATWERLYVSTGENYHSVHIIDADTIYVVGAQQIMKTFDGGDSWTKLTIQAPPSYSYNLQVNASVFTSSKVGHAACANGLILKTKDGGLTWYKTESVSYFPSDYLCMTFVNENVGYASREYHDVLKTIDGGETWQLVGGYPDTIYDLFFVDAKIGYATGEYGVVHKTVDGGVSWQWAGFLNARYDASTLYGLYFFDANQGIVVGARGRIMKTENGGTDWTAYGLMYENVNKVSFPTNTTGYAFGDRIYKTTDQGDTWTPLTTGFKEDEFYYPYGYFVTADHGYATMSNYYYNGGVLRTTDGGQTWKPTGVAGSSISFVNANVGYIAGDGLSKTTDGGATWAAVSSNINPRQVSFTTEAKGFGLVDRDLYKTIDGGISWERIRETYSSLYQIDFVNEMVGFVSGDYGLLLKTTNGGDTWEELQGFTSDQYVALDFVSENVGAIASAYGNALITTDGGATWLWQGAPGGINSLAITNDNKILAGGNYGALQRNVLPIADYSLTAMGADTITAVSAWIAVAAAAGNGDLTNLRIEYGADGFTQNLPLTPAKLASGKNKKYVIQLTNLKPSTYYFFRVSGTFNGTTRTSLAGTFTTKPDLSLTMGYIWPDKPHAANFYATVTSNRSDITDILFQYDTTTQFRQTIVAKPSRVSAFQSTPVSAAVSNLKAGTRYFARLQVTSNNQVFYSDTVLFTTNPEFWVIYGSPVVDDHRVTLSARVTSNEKALTNLQYQYGTRRQYDQAITATPSGVNGLQSSDINATITAPYADSVYFYRIKGTLSGNTVYSQEAMFRLSGGVLVVAGKTESITSGSARLTGLVAPQGEYVYWVTIEYGPTTDYGKSVYQYNLPQGGTVKVSTDVTGLAPGEEYHYRVVVTTNKGEYMSDDQVFRTETVTGVEDAQAESLGVYPNPASGKVMITYSQILESIEVMDGRGQLLYRAEPRAREYQLDVTGYASGLYYIRFVHGQKNGAAKLLKK
ncbi:MAG TPA: YCF48-related protein [Chryseolinea sp.]